MSNTKPRNRPLLTVSLPPPLGFRIIKTRAPDAAKHRCARTDKGVSALGQVVSLRIRSNLREGFGVLGPATPHDPDVDNELPGLLLQNSPSLGPCAPPRPDHSHTHTYIQVCIFLYMYVCVNTKYYIQICGGCPSGLCPLSTVTHPQTHTFEAPAGGGGGGGGGGSDGEDEGGGDDRSGPGREYWRNRPEGCPHPGCSQDDLARSVAAERGGGRGREEGEGEAG